MVRIADFYEPNEFRHTDEANDAHGHLTLSGRGPPDGQSSPELTGYWREDHFRHNRAVEDCIHGLAVEWCGVCSAAPDPASGSRVGSYDLHGGETKQDVLNDITDLLRMPRQAVSVGSSLPSDVFTEAARRVDVSDGSMPEICERIVRKAGHSYTPAYDSRGSASGGGSTVTLEGIQAMRKALRALLT